MTRNTFPATIGFGIRVAALCVPKEPQRNEPQKAQRAQKRLEFGPQSPFCDFCGSFLYYARLLPAHFAKLRLGLRCVHKAKRRVPRAPRPHARLTNPRIADARGRFPLLPKNNGPRPRACAQYHWRVRGIIMSLVESNLDRGSGWGLVGASGSPVLAERRGSLEHLLAPTYGGACRRGAFRCQALTT